MPPTGKIIYILSFYYFQILKNMNSRIQGTRQEACGVLYLLMRNNFEHTQRRDFNRVHLQVGMDWKNINETVFADFTAK